MRLCLVTLTIALSTLDSGHTNCIGGGMMFPNMSLTCLEIYVLKHSLNIF